MYKIAIVEDDLVFGDSLKKEILNCQTNELSFDIDLFSNAVDFLKDFKSNYDLIFLDIRMPILSGMECAKRIREKDNEVMLVFVTSLMQYAIDGYQVNAFDYLLKPLDSEFFKIKFKRIINHLKHIDKEHYLTLPSENGIIKVPTKDIIYIETIKHALIFHTVNGDYKKYDSLSTYEEKLESQHFIRCNSCYLVNLNYVKKVDKENLLLILSKNDISLQISRPKKKSVLEALKKEN